MSAEPPASSRAALAQGEIELCASHAACLMIDPPLGKFPPMSFSHPVLHNASARWRAGGGSTGLLAILKCARHLLA
eukprot:scaffold118243_cov49-Tisochrysis_lutea.AAC.1